MREWVNYISAFSIAFPVFFSLYAYRKLALEMRMLSWFFTCAAAIELIILVSAFLKVNNLWLINLYALAEGIVLLYVIGRWLKHPRLFSLSILILVIYAAYWIYSTWVLGSLYLFNSREKAVKAIFLILLSGHLLIRQSLTEDIIITNNPVFWILSAILIYFSVSIIVFCTATFVLDNKNMAMMYSWTIHSIVNIIANLLFAVGFICTYRKTNYYL